MGDASSSNGKCRAESMAWAGFNYASKIKPATNWFANRDLKKNLMNYLHSKIAIILWLVTG